MQKAFLHKKNISVNTKETHVKNFSLVFDKWRGRSERPERAIENSPGCSVAQPRDATPGLCESVILTKVKGIVKCGSRRGLPT